MSQTLSSLATMSGQITTVVNAATSMTAEDLSSGLPPEDVVSNVVVAEFNPASFSRSPVVFVAAVTSFALTTQQQTTRQYVTAVMSRGKYRSKVNINHIIHNTYHVSIIMDIAYLFITYLRVGPLTRWLGSRVVSVLDSGSEEHGFKSHTPIVPLFTKQQNW